MPELPDVQVFKEYADATSLHRRIDDVSLSEDLVHGVAPQRLRQRLRGARLESTRRHGKHLFLQVDDQGWLRLHFGMTATLRAYGADDHPEHTALRLDFADGGHLAYTNMRRLGEISWVDDVDGFVEDEQLGPDPLVDHVGRDELADRLRGRRGSVKSALMDQRLLAGLGNVYADEILFHAGLHPESTVDALDDDAFGRLHRAVHDVAETAIGARVDVGAMPGSWLLPHREEGAPCPRCDGRIERRKVAGRSTYHCSRHQERVR